MLYVRSDALSLHGALVSKAYQLTSDLCDESGALVQSPVCHGDSGGPVYLGPRDKTLEKLKLAGISAGYLPGPGIKAYSAHVVATHCATQKSSVITGLSGLASFVDKGKARFGL